MARLSVVRATLTLPLTTLSSSLVSVVAIGIIGHLEVGHIILELGIAKASKEVVGVLEHFGRTECPLAKSSTLSVFAYDSAMRLRTTY